MVLVKRRQTPGHLEELQGYDESSSMSVSVGRATSPVSSLSALHFSSKKNTGKKTSTAAMLIGFFVIMGSWLTGINAIFRAHAALKEMKQAYAIKEEDRDTALQALKKTEATLKPIQDQVTGLKNTNQILKHEVKVMSEMEELGTGKQRRREEKKGVAQHDLLMEWLEERHDVLTKKADDLKTYIQEESRKAVLTKFGPGPHKVRFHVQIGDKNQARVVTIKMASLDEMPYTVYMFMEMVSQGLWDSCVFWRGVEEADHVLMGSPLANHNGESKIRQFEGKGLSELSFPEYSPKYPHKVGTVSFNKLGPGFFINMEDNTNLHGPGGQDHHELPGDAEPCFAEVIEGMDVVKKMHAFRGTTKSKNARYKNNPLNGMPVSRIVKAVIL